MATSVAAVLPENLREKVSQSKIFVVGAGGIGCELIKNLVLTGFEDIELIDLDTIDVSNLNRQFLFRKEHVGKSKAQVAKESALRFNPNAKIVAHHDNIMSNDYGVNFFKGFTMVMNALDNRAARNHVNRMCLAADIPLIESGTAGYLGQVTVIKKGSTECYECKPKPHQKTFPGCTIRNTPSEPIHCIVWAKHLFNQLFGEVDPDQDVSPDTEDPEAAGDAGESALQTDAVEGVAGGIERKSTRVWAQDTGYDPHKIFHKLFRDDIKYLLSMGNLWKKRRPPTPLDLDSLPDTAEESQGGGIADQRVWSVKECVEVFSSSVCSLREQFKQQGDGAMLVWDKDDKPAMDFVAAAANIRSFIYGIPQKSRFDIKSMAGNIIPAIATTNAIIAGLIVMEAFKLLTDRFNECRTVYLSRQPNPRKRLLNPCVLEPRNPKCYVCSEKPEVTLVLNTTTVNIKTLEDKVLKAALGMVAPDVEVDDGKGTIIISSEAGETEGNATKMLSEFNIVDGTKLKCDDFLQVLSLNVIIAHVEKLEEEREFEVVGDLSELKAKEEEKQQTGEDKSENKQETVNGGGACNVEDDDLMVIEEGDESSANGDSRKRKAEEPAAGDMVDKKRKSLDDNDDVIVL